MSSEGKRWLVGVSKQTAKWTWEVELQSTEHGSPDFASHLVDASEVERLEEFVGADKTAQARIKELIEFLDATEAEVERLREALGKIAETDPKGAPWHPGAAEIARAALHPDEKEEQ